MIRTLVTAHINSLDLHELTIQINDRSLGYLTAQKQQNYVASTNRRVQMITGIRSDRLDQTLIVESRDMLRKWSAVFRELQIYGLDVFPSILKRESLHAEFLFLICDEIVMALISRNWGLYLQRGGRLYRQQPATPQGSVIPASFMKAADYYAFIPTEGDIIMALDPAFIDLFEPHGLEEILADPRQMTVKMAELTTLASAYGYASDHSWIGFQVSRIEQPLHTRKANLQKISVSREYLSRVMPVSGSNRLAVDVKRDPGQEESRRGHVQADAGFPRLSGSHRIGDKAEEEENIKIRVSEADFNYSKRPSGLEAQREYEGNVSLIDKIKLMEFKKPKRIWEKFRHRATNLFPSSKPLSILALVAGGLLLLVLLLLTFNLLKGGDQTGKQPDTVTTISQPLAENGQVNTPATDFEIKLTVKAQSMQIMSAPGGAELIATVVRGDTVWQLTKEDKDGWVMIRLSDGRTGYVPLAVLIPGD